ncbi:MAG TPA: hypothetical protein VH351_12320 [Bryobacteraceae bacterium]|nr:hypothetical protein [Bryobacteraceae bacterium]
MAKKLAEFQTAFQKAEANLKAAESGLERYLNNRQKQWELLGHGGDSLKDRIAALKKKGVTGASADEFAKKDAEALTLLKGIKDFYAALIGTINNYNVEHKKYTSARDEVKSISTTLEAEVAARDKKKEGIIAMDSKSLPDLKKLAAAVQKKLNECRDTLGVYSLIDENKQQVLLAKLLKDTV